MQLNLRNLTTIATLAASGVACAQSSGTAFVVAPDALLVVAGSQFELNDIGASKATLQRIINGYKGTAAAKSAEARLKLF